MQKGFKNVQYVGKPYDFRAEKDGFRFTIEIKGTEQSGVMGRLVVPWHELKPLYKRYLMKKNEKALLMFVNMSYEYAIFEMLDAFIM